MYYDTMVNRLNTYDIGVGDKVFILSCPNAINGVYSYKEATIIRIVKNTSIHEKPTENTKHYKAKMRMWLEYMNKDECDKCKFTVNCKGDHYSREIPRKYLYTVDEFNILQEDIQNLNEVHKFKKRQQLELIEFIKTRFTNWDYYSFENRRKTKRRDEDMPLKERLCPRCGNTYMDYPAISRKDNKTEVCTTCGQAEALLQYTGVDLKDDIWKIESK